MVKAIFIFFMFPLLVFAQGKPNQVVQIQPKEILSGLKVKKRTGIEYSYTDSTFYDNVLKMRGDTQSLSIFSKVGLLIKKENHFNYTSAGVLRRSFEFDNNDRLLSSREMVGDSLVKQEEFVYSPGGTLMDWTIIQGKNKFNQEYFYDEHGNPRLIKVKDKKRKLVRRDSILYEYDEQNRPVKEWSFNIKNELADSLTYEYGDDTLSRKMLIIDDQLSFIYYKIKFGAFIFDRIEEYTEGHFMGVYSRMYDGEGNLLKERNIHHYTNLNYTKNYLYNKDGLLVEKQVFEDTFEPTKIVLYNYEYYD